MKTEIYYTDDKMEEYESATVDLKHRVVIAPDKGDQHIIPFENLFLIKVIDAQSNQIEI